jgi:cell wall-associated NlpC family hydrolase
VKKLVALGCVVLVSPVALAALVVSPPGERAERASAVAFQEVPADLLPVYRSAALTCPGLPWQVLAGIGWVESRHARGASDPATGAVSLLIIGPAIDGRPGFAAIPDPSQPDGWAHAVGPMQFLTTTWERWGTVAPDRPPGSMPDPHNAWDAIYSAAAYLCAGQGQVGDLRAAILRYNRSETYVDDVLDKARTYGLGSGETVADVALPGSGEEVVRHAMTQLGVPYVWGGTTPGVGFDCSGLVQWAYRQIGVELPRTTQQQILVGVAVSVEELRPGDLVFTRSDRGSYTLDYGHVAIYAGGGQEIIAPRSGDVISLRPVQMTNVQAVRRVTR